MCMGIGCNAAGVTGCRIIDSPRERAVAVITNSLVPCNGRFPTLICLITAFLTVGIGENGSFAAVAILFGMIMLSVGMTLAVTRLLSATVYRGEAAPFLLELPPYRVPQFGKSILRSLKDKTLVTLGRAASVAAPFGLVLYLLGNLTVGNTGVSILTSVAEFLDPFGKFFGMDGVIVLAFLLSLPANEIFLPVALMVYASTGVLTPGASTEVIASALTGNGWTPVTAICVSIFVLFHWPCSTTIWTIAKETKSVKCVALSVLLPTGIGLAMCAIVRWGYQLVVMCL